MLFPCIDVENGKGFRLSSCARSDSPVAKSDCDLQTLDVLWRSWLMYEKCVSANLCCSGVCWTGRKTELVCFAPGRQRIVLCDGVSSDSQVCSQGAGHTGPEKRDAHGSSLSYKSLDVHVSPADISLALNLPVCVFLGVRFQSVKHYHHPARIVPQNHATTYPALQKQPAHPLGIFSHPGAALGLFFALRQK